MMDDRDALLKRTLAGRVLAIVRLPDAEGLDETAAALIRHQVPAAVGELESDNTAVPRVGTAGHVPGGYHPVG